MKVTSKGRVTIPSNVRQKRGIVPESEVEIVIEREAVLLKTTDIAGSKGKRTVDSLRGRATVLMTTDEIMALTRSDA